MYCAGLGFERLGSFEDHAGFDGVMLGHAGAEYHLEFTRQVGQPSGARPTAEDLLVFYLPEPALWAESCARMLGAGFREVVAHNPYWGERGKTFEDLDGYRVVLQGAAWGA